MKLNAALCYKGAIEYTTEKMIVRRQVQLKLGRDVQVGGWPLEGLGEFFSEGAVGTLRTGGVVTFVLLAATLTARTGCGSVVRGICGRGTLSLRARRLSLIGSQEPVFERCAIKAANDEIHLFGVGRVDECETLGLLCLGIANHLYVVECQVLCGKPGLDIVFGDPHR